MDGIRITKDFWPKPNVLAWPDGFGSLDRILQPIADHLDLCWWFIGGQGVNLPLNLPKGPNVPEDARARALDEYKKKMDEICRYLTEGGLSGSPGFFRRGARGLSGDWKFYVASDASEEPIAYFNHLLSNHPNLLARPEPGPDDVMLIAYGIDWVRWDIFFRDRWMYEKVWQHVRRREHLKVEAM